MVENDILVARSQAPDLVVIHKSGKAGKDGTSTFVYNGERYCWEWGFDQILSLLP